MTDIMPPPAGSRPGLLRRRVGELSAAECARLYAAITEMFAAEDRRLARLESILADYPSSVTQEELREIAHLVVHTEADAA